MIGVLGYLAAIYGYYSEAEQQNLADPVNLPEAGVFAPLVGFVVAEVALLLAISFILLVPNPRKQRVE